MNKGVLYEVETGRIIQCMVLPKLLDIETDYTPALGLTILPGVLADDVDCWKVVDGALVEFTPPAPDFTSIIMAAKFQVDVIAGSERSRVGSSGYGQEATYILKDVQARAFLSDEALGLSPVPADYPLPFATSGTTDVEMHDECIEIVEKADQWYAILALIETVRLGAKKAIDAATTQDEINSIVAAISWPN